MKRAPLLTAFSSLLAASLLGQFAPNDITESPDQQRYSLSAYQAGHYDAEKDMRENRFVIEDHGLPPPCYADYAKLLDERYHIQLKMVAGCVADERIVGHEKGYNEVSIAEIQRRFGGNVLEKTKAEACSR